MDLNAINAADRSIQTHIAQSSTTAKTNIAAVKTSGANTQAYTESSLKRVIAEANAVLPPKLAKNISLSFDSRLGSMYVQVRDTGSGEVLREIPTKEVRDFHAAMIEWIGLIVDKKA